MSVIIVGMLPTETKGTFGERNARIDEVNKLLKEFCSSQSPEDFSYVEQASCWKEDSGEINRSLFRWDGLHLNKRGCAMLAQIFNNAINRVYQHRNSIEVAATVNVNQNIPISKKTQHDEQTEEVILKMPTTNEIDYHHVDYHRCHNRPRKTKKRRETKLYNSVKNQNQKPQVD